MCKNTQPISSYNFSDYQKSPLDDGTYWLSKPGNTPQQNAAATKAYTAAVKNGTVATSSGGVSNDLMDIYMKQMLAVKTGVNPFTGKVLTEWEKKQFAYAGAVGMLNLGYLGVWGSGVYKGSIGNSVNKEPVKNSNQASDIFAYQKYKESLLKGDIVENSKSIISGDKLKDPKLINELTKDGSSMSDWAKMESEFSYTSNFGTGKVHYYKNLKTGEVSSYDAKIKVSKPKDLRSGVGDDFWIVELDSNFIPIGVRK